jgi:hypothetical protein
MHQTTLDRIRRALLQTATVIIALAGHARAQSADAEALFDQGDRLMAEGNFAQACEAFAASNRIEQRAGTLVRLGECREQNKQYASAWSAYKDALTRVRDPEKKAIATAKVAELEPRLSYMIVSVPDEARVDGLVLTRNDVVLDPAMWNRALPVDGGTYTVGGKAPGHEEWRTTVEVAPEGGKVSVDVPRFKDLARLIAPPRVAGPTQPMMVRAPATPSMFTLRRDVAIGAGGVAVAAVAIGAVLGLEARAKQHDAEALCPDAGMPCAQGNRANQLISDGKARAEAADLAFGVGAAAAIGAGVLWYLGAPSERAPRERERGIAIAPSANGLVVVGSF